MSESVITRKGQVTIPKDIRDRLNAREGDRVVFVLRGEEVALKVLRGNILDLGGSVKPRKRPEDFDQVRKSVRRSLGSKLAGNG